jgi:hypothetical protein
MTSASRSKGEDGRPVWRDAAGVPFLEADNTPLSTPLRSLGVRRIRKPAHLTDQEGQNR